MLPEGEVDQTGKASERVTEQARWDCKRNRATAKWWKFTGAAYRQYWGSIGRGSEVRGRRSNNGPTKYPLWQKPVEPSRERRNNVLASN